MKILDKIKKFWNETLGPDYEEVEELNINSSDPVEATLAKSSKKIDEEFQNYGESSKAKRDKMINEIKVEKNDLGKTKGKTKSKKLEEEERTH